ncbi:MAG: S1C family serine protease [Actinomycetes bacterium]
MTEDTRTFPSYPDHYGPAGEPAQEPLPGLDAGRPDLPPPPSHGSPDPRRRRGVTSLVAVALAAGLLGGGVGAAVTTQVDKPASSTTASALTAPVGSSGSNAKTTAVEQVAAKLLPSVVSIQERNANGGGEGTGVILSANGLILTNNHVVADAANGGSLTVTLNNGKTAAASIVGRDPVTDLAVIRVNGLSGLTPATFGSSAGLKPGEGVVAIGSPLGLQGSVTSGIVSALDRPVRTGGESAAGDPTSTVIDAIQTDAAINPGNSGGPLVNLSGQVVGINSAIASLGSSSSGQSGSIGLGFAIPVDQARQVAQQLITSGKATHAQLGVGVRDAGTTTTSGAALAAVNQGSAAQRAGLRAGDVVTSVGDRRVDSADALIAAIRSHQPGDKVTLTYLRGGKSAQTAVTLGSDAKGT